ncbi:MAG: hypothetical protein A4E70_00835 [Syntrophus sp. PtaU1.Bin005]|jgi:hypothetical protein|nr:MAG: hypothetical protein A4E70_00835 [Syntrophus sp. PtaU1.Bin005]
MTSRIGIFLVMALFFGFCGASEGGEEGLHVSVSNGLVRISSTESTLSEILEKLSRKLGMTIHAYGAREDAVVACEIEGVGVAEALQRLVPQWNSLIFSRDDHSIEIGVSGSEDDGASAESDSTEPENGTESAPSLNGEEDEMPEEEAVPHDEEAAGDSTTGEAPEDEDGNEATAPDPDPGDVQEEDEPTDEFTMNEPGSRPRRHGTWQF